MSKTKYFGRDQRPLPLSEWSELRNNHSYAIVREYRNDDVWVVLEWDGRIPDITTFRDCWKMFVLQVMNRTATGEWIKDPVEWGKTFAYEADGVKAYEAFLERWTASHRNADGEFEEEDNELTPPPPPDPDAPSTDVSDIKSVSLGDDDVGVW